MAACRENEETKEDAQGLSVVARFDIENGLFFVGRAVLYYMRSGCGNLPVILVTADHPDEHIFHCVLVARGEWHNVLGCPYFFVRLSDARVRRRCIPRHEALKL